jgi:MoaA/NifB/PqqE/SkfB family radical SAM enzyme
VPRLIDESFTLRRVARRAGWRSRHMRELPPERPVGVKLELTHACNLRCGFCYTDSPRHTLLRTPDLPDEAWHRIAAEAADLGVIEIVLSGGEPFLRRDLVMSLVDSLKQRELGITLNTNGWFVDDAAADRLADVRGIQVDISIDGATPALHDASRGVPGSWRRAVEATSRLLDRGVRVQVVHVVTPENQDGFKSFLEQMWTLGVTSVRATPVVEVGAAARGGRWAVNRDRLRRTIRAFTRSHGEGMRVGLQPGNAGVLAIHDHAAPASMLIRPSGTVLADSLHPFSFGNAAEEGLEQCWARLRARWNDDEISRWAGSLRRSRDLASADVIPYLNDEVPVGDGEGLTVTSASHAAEPVPERAEPKDDTGDPAANLARAREHVRGLALERRYRLGSALVGGGPADHYVRQSDTGKVVKLNATAAMMLRELDGSTPAEAVDRLAGRFDGVDRSRLEADVIDTGRSLARQGILVPAGTR